jgi:hypothetical protein
MSKKVKLPLCTRYRHTGEWRFLNFKLDRDKRFHIVVAIYWGKRPRYQLKRRLGGAQCHSGPSGEQKKSLLLAGN